MKKLKIVMAVSTFLIVASSCSVQQFAVNTKTKPFENGGKVWGEKVEKCGENPWKLDYRKGADLHILGINVKQSDAKKMAEELGATAYTIETKSNLLLTILTFGIADYKIVKVIKRAN